MPNNTTSKSPRRPTPKASRRPGRSTSTAGTGGRFGRTTQAQKRPTRVPTLNPTRKGKSPAKKGLAGLLSSLPVSGLSKGAAGKSSSSSSSKAKPAAALLAAGAGALLGRKQMQKRKDDETQVVAPATPAAPTTQGAV